jgi:heme exporter protein CcmD
VIAIAGGAVLALEDAGFILGSYAVTFAVIAGFTWRVLRSGRRLADRIDDQDKYWT